MQRILILLLVFLALLQYRLWLGDANLLELRRMKDRITELQLEGEKRRLRNAALDAEIQDLKQGTEAIEESARQNLGMIKSGEALIQLVDDPSAQGYPGATPVPPARTELPAEPARAPGRSGDAKKDVR